MWRALSPQVSAVATKWGHEHRGVTASHNFYMPICGKHQVPRTLSAEAHANAMTHVVFFTQSDFSTTLRSSRESINCALHVRDLWLCVLPRWQFNVNVHVNSSFFTRESTRGKLGIFVDPPHHE